MKNVRVVPLVAAGLAAALLASPVLANGQSNSVLNNPAFSAAVAEAQGATAGTWLQGAQVAAGRGVIRYAHAQCPDNTTSFYTLGGVSEAFGLSNAVSRYDADTNTWATLANFPSPQEGPSGVCYQGKIYVAGGGGLTQFFIYDIAANTWAPGAALPRAMWGAAMGAWLGKVYMIGGDNDFSFGGTSNQVNIYDIATNTWLANGAPMPVAALSPGFAQIGSFLYIVGGWNDLSPAQNVTATQRYDLATNTWQAGPTFTGARSDMPLSATATALYAIGGDSTGGGAFNPSAVVDRLDLSTWPAGAWAVTDALPAPLMAQKGGFCTAEFFATGEVWVTNGYTGFSVTRANQYLAAEPCPVSASVAPVALAVDTAGNNVLEPNEASVIVAPSWRNTGASAIASLAGAATNFTGPVGPTYTLNDAIASYGTVAAGATASCTATGNCYAVTVTAATRPVVHWDSTMTETVTPTGTAKDWTLHIGDSFTDVPTTNGFYRFIETILHKNVTGGCTATTYCPTASTTREQMAVFVLVAKEPAGYVPPPCGATPMFTDVPVSSGFCKWIEELARRGVVGGCGGSNYCPSSPATREQMAVFVLRTLDPALNPPACGTPVFADVPASSGFCRWIEELARRGVVTGCGGGNYCPTADVTREQMSVFLAVTFSLTLYGL